MAEPAVARLAAELRVSKAELSVLEAFTDDQIAALGSAVAAAIAADAGDIEESVEHAIRAIPRPLRGRARRLLIPDDRRG